ncbi:glycosyltransferase family 4 protein [Marinobacter panjinensis]|uniref:Glycosyltransferase family 4 protein n=1 Tax=Marinobacter panjinensis TaxID=2576384 RepID=A0A4U6R0Y6_9GAMM|nr:glycosyltransferase family 1 protein [Marinobacter panjinensis]MCR8915741.1 glycosyltransferase family 4 protein [Marinobacter panjinensis]TKV67277.1 glycosyltransferase family 4 protein [Marinobacter panjinensis]
MYIGIDATCWWNQRGFGRMARELLSAMFALESDHTFYLFIDQAPTESMNLPNVEIVQVFPDRPATSAAIASSRRSIKDMVQLYRAVSRSPIDLMFFPAVYSWFPVSSKLPAVVTLHDAIAEHFPDMIFPDWKGRLFWTLKVKLALWQCKRVMTVSQAAKAEIEQYLGVNGNLIDVISEAPHGLFCQSEDPTASKELRQRIGLPQDGQLIVYVGGLAPHKNLLGFLEGFARAREKQEIDDVHVVLVGDYGGAGFHSNYDELQQLANDKRIQGMVHFTGFISDEDLLVLYNNAMAAAMPSFSEGFGLPAVEAMACGTPILSSDKGSLPEVVGDAGVFFDPYDVESISRAIVKISTDVELRQQLSDVAVSRARSFTWERAAKLALSYLEAAAKGSGARHG